MDKFKHSPKPYLLLSATCDENVVMNDWNVDEKSFGKWQYLQHNKSLIPQKITNNDK